MHPFVTGREIIEQRFDGGRRGGFRLRILHLLHHALGRDQDLADVVQRVVCGFGIAGGKFVADLVTQ